MGRVSGMAARSADFYRRCCRSASSLLPQFIPLVVGWFMNTMPVESGETIGDGSQRTSRGRKSAISGNSSSTTRPNESGITKISAPAVTSYSSVSGTTDFKTYRLNPTGGVIAAISIKDLRYGLAVNESGHALVGLSYGLQIRGMYNDPDQRAAVRNSCATILII